MGSLGMALYHKVTLLRDVWSKEIHIKLWVQLALLETQETTVLGQRNDNG